MPKGLAEHLLEEEKSNGYEPLGSNSHIPTGYTFSQQVSPMDSGLLLQEMFLIKELHPVANQNIPFSVFTQ